MTDDVGHDFSQIGNRRYSNATMQNLQRLSVIGLESSNVLPAQQEDTDMTKPVPESIARWWVASVYASWVLLALVVGCLCGLVSALFHKVVLGGIKWIRIEPAWYIADSLSLDWWPVLHYTLTSIISALMIGKAREIMPAIAGGGFVNVKKCILERAPIPAYVGLQRMLATSFYIGCGAPLCAEGPTMHVCSTVACTMYRMCSRFIGQRAFPKDALPQIVIAGCAYGMAAAYISPLGGTLHAMEEFLDSSTSQVLVALLAMGSVCSAWVARMISGHREIWILHPVADSSAELHPWMLISVPFGIVLGILGGCLVRCVADLRDYLKRRDVSPMKSMLLSACITSACAVIVHLLTTSRDGICSPKLYLDHLRSKKDDHGSVPPNPPYSSCNWGLGMEIWGMSSETLQLQMISEPPLPPSSILSFCFFKSVAVIVAFASNGPGGIFTPSLIIGGCLGAVLHSLIRICLYGDVTDNPLDAQQFRTCILMGMAGFYSSVVRLPLCATLVSVEVVAYASLGDVNTTLCFPILLCCMSSYVTAVYFSPDTLFEILLKQDGVSEHQILNSKPQLSSALGNPHADSPDTLSIEAVSRSRSDSVISVPESVNSSMKGLALLNPALARQYCSPEGSSRSRRGSMTNVSETSRSRRGSIISETSRSRRGSMTNISETCSSYEFMPAENTSHDGASDMSSECSRNVYPAQSTVDEQRKQVDKQVSSRKSRKGDQQLVVGKCKSVGSRPSSKDQPLFTKKGKNGKRIASLPGPSISAAHVSKRVAPSSPSGASTGQACKGSILQRMVAPTDETSHGSRNDEPSSPLSPQRVMTKSHTWQPGQRPPPLEMRKNCPGLVSASGNSSSGSSTPRCRERGAARSASLRRSRRCHSGGGGGERSKGVSPLRGDTPGASQQTSTGGDLNAEGVNVNALLDQLMTLDGRLPRSVSDIAEDEHAEIPWNRSPSDTKNFTDGTL